MSVAHGARGRGRGVAIRALGARYAGQVALGLLVAIAAVALRASAPAATFVASRIGRRPSTVPSRTRAPSPRWGKAVADVHGTTERAARQQPSAAEVLAVVAVAAVAALAAGIAWLVPTLASWMHSGRFEHITLGDAAGAVASGRLFGPDPASAYPHGKPR